MKKLLSIVLALSLCLTAMMGCFVVSAETTNSVTVETVTIATGAETTDVDVTFNFVETFAASKFTVGFEGLSLAKITYDEDAIVISHGATDGDNDVFDGITSLTCILDAVNAEELGAFNDVVITLTFDTADLAVGNYAITFTGDVASAGTYDAETGWTGDEKMLEYTAVDGAIVVEEAVTCEHNYEVTYATAATGEKNTTTTTTPGTLTETCTICGDKIENQTVYYSDSYRANYVNLDLDAEISFQYHVKDSVIEGAENVAFKTTFEIDGVDPLVDYKTLDEASDTMRGDNKDIPCQTIKTGVAAKYMTDNLTLNTFVKIDGVWYSGRIQTYNIVDVAKMNVTSSDAEELALYANLLNYGGEAQKYFKYRTDNLANSADNLGGFAPYVTEELPEVEADMVNSYTLPTVRFSNFKYALESKISLKLAYRLDTAETVPDVANLKTVVSYTYAGVSMTKEYTDFELYDASSYSDRYGFYLDAFAAKQMRTPFTVTIYDGETKCAADFNGSIAGIAKYLIDSGSAAQEGSVDLFYAMISYGDAAAAYLA